MILPLPGGEVCRISDTFGASNGVREASRRSPAVLVIFLSLNLYFLTIVGGTNCYKKARSAGTAKKETLILNVVYDLNCDTSNGAIDFSGKANKLSFDTSNGAIRAEVPADKDIGVKVEKADTSVGKVKVDLKDFMVTDKEKSYGPSGSLTGQTKNFDHADYKIVISAKTSVGAITIE